MEKTNIFLSGGYKLLGFLCFVCSVNVLAQIYTKDNAVIYVSQGTKIYDTSASSEKKDEIYVVEGTSIRNLQESTKAHIVYIDVSQSQQKPPTRNISKIVIKKQKTLAKDTPKKVQIRRKQTGNLKEQSIYTPAKVPDTFFGIGKSNVFVITTPENKHRQTIVENLGNISCLNFSTDLRSLIIERQENFRENYLFNSFTIRPPPFLYKTYKI